MKAFSLTLVFVAVSAGVLQIGIHPSAKADGSLPHQSSSENEIGVALYPQATDLPEATQRLMQTKASNWLLARAFHTDDSIKDVANFFKKQQEKVNKPAGASPILTSLLRDNWKISKGTVRSAKVVFGVGKELRESYPIQQIKTSFGVISLQDSFVRVH